MPPPERRNHYRMLFVQPEAPAEVIKAAYRALMSTLRAHPDLGGDPERAARLNAAYQVLGDPEARARYDQSLRRGGRGKAAADAVAPHPAAWRADKRCPFCQLAFSAEPAPGLRCARCDSPLGPAPGGERAGNELVGRRRGERFGRDIDVVLRLPGAGREASARLRDVSLTGLSLLHTQPLPAGTALRVIAPQFDTVAVVVSCHAAGARHAVHARLLTLQLLKTGRGVYVDVRA
ncbi:MAG: J domain-containing protein [Burkholderiaceae bacterium]